VGSYPSKTAIAIILHTEETVRTDITDNGKEKTYALFNY
jgi:hypothetical protein